MSDIYDEVTNFSNVLRSHGHSELSDRLEDAILSGSTGTEICMALRFHMNEIALITILEQGDVLEAKRLLEKFETLLR